MRAAIYARRSTDEHQAASLEVQLEEAKRYISKKGWSLSEEHIYREDAVSRAEFKKRPALIAMLNAASAGGFDVVVTRDETRLGGDVNRTGLLIQDLLDAGVQLFYYFTDERVVLDDAIAKFMVAARNFAAELEREKISQRTREHLQFKARRGFNAGGRVYGYDNVRGPDGVDFKINDEQAEVLRQFARHFAEGAGYATLARELNDRRVPSPRAGSRGTGSWSPSAIKSMLMNERYRGLIRYGEFRKGYRGGTKVRTRTAETEWIIVERPDLRIFDEELWSLVQARLERNRKSYGFTSKRGPRKHHLLSSLVRCGVCGGPMQVETAKHGSAKVKVYHCTYNKKRGAAVCTNSMRRPAEGIDAALVSWIQDTLLHEKAVVALIRNVRERLRARSESSGSEVPKLETQAAKLKKEIANLTVSLADLGHSKAIAEALAERERQLEQVHGLIEASKAAPAAIDLECARIEEESRARVADLRKLLDGDPAEAHRAMEALFVEPLVFTPLKTESGPAYRIQGKVASGTLFNFAPNETSPRGFEPRSPA